jgi:hypothetical protein
MPSGHIEILHDFTTITHKVIVTIAENSNPNAEVAPRVVLDAPHIAGTVTLFSNLRLVLHRLKFYESTDGVTLETLLHAWTVQANKSKQVVVPYYYIVDRGNSGVNPNYSDPVSGQSQVIDERWADASEVVILSEGGGLRQPGESYNILAGGGWELLNGEQFSSEEKWTILAIYDVDVVENSPGGATSDEDINEISANGNFDNTYYSKTNVAKFVGASGNTSFPAFSTIPSKTKATFSAFTGAQRQWILQFSAGDTVRYNGQDKNRIVLGKDEWIELFWKLDTVSGDVICYAKGNTGHHRVGQRVFVDRWDFVSGNNGNKILCDGTQYNISDLQRAYDDHVNILPAGQVVTEVQWQADPTKQHYWAIDAVAQKIRAPKDIDMHYRALKTNDGANGVPGLYTPDDIKAHTHDTDIPSRNLQNDSSVGPDLTGPDGGATGGSKRTFTSKSTGGAETAVKAVRQYAAVYI